MARLRASWRTSLPVVQQPRNPQSESIARSPYDQAKYWPAVEEAIRARAMARHQRLANLVARASGQREFSPVELLRDRADALVTRAAGLKKLADAWQPLSESLDPNQKARLRFLAVYVLREMRDAAESRRVQSEDEGYDDYEE